MNESQDPDTVRSESPGPPEDTLFRGQASRNWALSSEFERKLSTIDDLPEVRVLQAICAEHLAAFQETAAGLLGNEARNFTDDDWWALGKHNGLNTPLLDWSRSPYVSSFFALSEHRRLSQAGAQRDEVVAIWALADWQSLIRPGEFEIVAPKAFSNPRQRAQRGVFTRLTHQQHFDVTSYLVGRNCAEHLVRWEVPVSDLDVALDDLRLANITPSTLFPDLGGAAAEANNAYERIFAREAGLSSRDEQSPVD